MKNCLPHGVVFLSLSLASFGSAPLHAQATASVQPQPTRFNRAPVSDEILQVHIPRAVKQTLPNGLKVLVLENHRAAAIDVNIYVNAAGGLFDPAGQPGLASMTAQMLSQ